MTRLKAKREKPQVTAASQVCHTIQDKLGHKKDPLNSCIRRPKSAAKEKQCSAALFSPALPTVPHLKVAFDTSEALIIQIRNQFNIVSQYTTFNGR